MNYYPGEAPTKKIARAQAYRVISRVLPASWFGTANVVALAGPGAHDIGPIRAFRLTEDASRVLFVDTDPRGLVAAEERWPGVRVFHGAMDRAPVPKPINVAVLDFCGHCDSPGVLAGYAALRGHVVPGTVISVTVQRGREPKGGEVTRIKGILDRKKAAASRLDSARLMTVGADLGRSLGIPFLIPRQSLTVAQRESDWCLLTVGQVKYTAHRTPMAVFVFQVCRAARRNVQGAWASSPGAHLSAVDVLRFADIWRRDGWSDETIAQALDVSPRTLAAWRAHRTMGTYSKPKPAAV